MRRFCGLERPRPSAIRLGQAARLARRRGDREQEVVDLNAKVPYGMNETKQEGLEVKFDPEADRDLCDGKENSRDNRYSGAFYRVINPGQ